MEINPDHAMREAANRAGGSENKFTEIEQLRSMYPNSASHPGRVRPSRWFLLLMGMVCFGLAALSWNLQDVPVDRRQNLALAIGALGVFFAIAAATFPGSVAATICGMFVGGNPIDDMLGIDAKATHEKSSSLFVEFGIFVVLVLAIETAFLLFEWGLFAFGAGILVPTVLWGISIIYRRKFRDSKRYDVQLDSLLESRGYAVDDKRHAAQFLKQSFLHSDVAMELKSFWFTYKRRDVLFWGRYGTGGYDLTSGIFCGIQFSQRPAATQIGHILSDVATVYFDNNSKSLFGTIRPIQAPKFFNLEGIPWQYVSGAIICRLDHEVLRTQEIEVSETTNRRTEQLVDSWEDFCESLQHQLQGHSR